EAGDDPKVVGLVYVSAFVPDVGETILGLLPKSTTPPPFDIDAGGFAWFQRDAFLAAFAPDVGKDLAKFMADSQIPLNVPKPGQQPLTHAAWHTRPVWYFSTKGDQVIPPASQHQMATRAKAVIVDSVGSHVGFISHPAAVAALIEKASKDPQVAKLAGH